MMTMPILAAAMPTGKNAVVRFTAVMAKRLIRYLKVLNRYRVTVSS